MNKKLIIVFLVITVFLAGCGSFYPSNQLAANQIPDIDQLAAVQRAVNEFYEETGVLPIKNSENDTDIFIKYLIDFSKLAPKYIASAPGNSYEKGGVYQYIIWDPENTRVVKLVDLQVPEQIRDVNMRFLASAYPQYKDKVVDFIYTIDFEKIGLDKQTTVKSPYSTTQLPLLVTTEGHVIVDYSIDLMQFIEENKLDVQPGEDVRMLLANESVVVPAYSVPYTVNEKNEVVFMYNPLEES